MHEFLEKMSKKFELVIFTAARQDYADVIIDKIDPEGKFIAHRLYRQHCEQVEVNLGSKKEYFIKNLDIITNRKKEDLLIIDNYVYSFAVDMDNGIPIKDYRYGKNDHELEFLCEALSDLKSFMDSRTYIKDKLKIDLLYGFLDKGMY